ncbi:MAG: 1-deoxy-D-xylulose-5-phosphate reductoisomerase [Acidobacteriota bacterium]|nr:1-deoxy-D-xylulose-5-phosphate reductoisomerase [Acidobacteriota bacterium]MDE2711576.1 1-deoxy-D-xylulose-5-phosphate reductoisomerase [Acidobacteriota bacterium]MXW70060.1 1-deoxy-D-xylulose-5-phosphate reductoisomerase [Acidobacteriota bacterium]
MSPETRGVSILGATGSIGSTTLEVVDRYPDRFRVVALAAGRASDRLYALCERYRPELVALGREAEAEKFERTHGRRLSGIEVAGGPGGLERAATAPDAGFVISGIVGAAGLRPTLAALHAGKVVGLANKESLVAAGAVMARAAAASGARLIPVDSEHAAIHQCLADRRDPVRRIWLTASGGPFRTASAAEIAAATPQLALRHPTWRMGPKITIDSATMMNKGLEMIEARWLFDQPPEAIRVVVHPESIVHSMVEFEDGSILAQLGVTHMRTPVQYALTWPERLPTGLAPLPLDRPLDLRFEPPDPDRFPCLRLAGEALAAGGDAPAVLNAANEVAVAAFLDGRIPFPGIPSVVGDTLAAHSPAEPEDLEGVARADAWARSYADELVEDLAPATAR